MDAAQCQANMTSPYISPRPTWPSVTQHGVPQWFADAKFGIYAQWGPTSVPAFGSGGSANDKPPFSSTARHGTCAREQRLPVTARVVD